MLVVGEVHTALVQNGAELSEETCQRLLRTRAGEPVRWATRPMPYARSPEHIEGVDCRLSTASGAQARGIGTVARQALITAGRVLQTSAYARLAPSTADRRQPWSYYMARPGVVVASGKCRPRDLADGFAATPAPADAMDLGAIGARAMDGLQSSPLLDRRPPFRLGRVRLRWIYETADEPAIGLVIEDDTIRTLRLAGPGEFEPELRTLCEEIALHDWLLTATLALVRRAQIGGSPREHTIGRLAPAIDHLIHLWMPAARTPERLGHYWAAIERVPGFTRQWTTLVDRIRDQLAMRTLDLLHGGQDTRQRERRRDARGEPGHPR